MADRGSCLVQLSRFQLLTPADWGRGNKRRPKQILASPLSGRLAAVDGESLQRSKQQEDKKSPTDSGRMECKDPDGQGGSKQAHAPDGACGEGIRQI